jgi:DNA-directed RNA polymerase subunit RPC12/RpoP
MSDEIEYDCTDCGRHVIAFGFFGAAEAEERCNSCQWIRDNVAPEHHGDARERLGVPLAGLAPPGAAGGVISKGGSERR